jgi:thiol-disulfide isomerase/thioredoxin
MVRICVLTVLLGLSPQAAHAELIELGVQGMDCETGCPLRVVKALLTIDGVSEVLVNFEDEWACLETSRSPSADELVAALATESYTLGAVRAVERCAVAPKIDHRDPWADTEGVDAQVISDGFEIDLDAERVLSKFTIFDFGASWCGPCHVAAKRLKELLLTTPDLAVRAISLGDDADQSFEKPVAKQHMAFADGLPWFIVVSPKGRTIYQGNELDAALKAIERKRK